MADHIETDPIEPPEPPRQTYCVSQTTTKFEYFDTEILALNELNYHSGMPDPVDGSIIELAVWNHEDQEWVRTHYNRQPEPE